MSMESFGGNVESDNDEQELTLLLAKLPLEIRTHWQKKADELALDEAIELVREAVKNRNEAKEKIFTELGDIENPELKEEVRSVIRAIETTFGDTNYFVGNGSVAEVYHMPYAPHVCVKYLVHPEKAREHGNNFREEKDYLEDLHRFTVDGIRVPDVYFYHMSDFGTCFGMENIDGLSLDRIIENPEGIDFLDVIASQKQEDVIQRMRNFITRMHKEKKIVHRDLSPRNIMVDKEGNWYVIDYGRARRIEIGDDTTDVSETTDIASAENAIRQLYAKIDTSRNL
jgi:tRNA A-37 threonylcarbamoyl transferase component Bud32